MKKPFESEDFERMIRSRLENYEADPGEETKKVILDSLQKKSYRGKVGAIAALLLLTSSVVFYGYLSNRQVESHTKAFDRTKQEPLITGRQSGNENGNDKERAEAKAEVFQGEKGSIRSSRRDWGGKESHPGLLTGEKSETPVLRNARVSGGFSGKEDIRNSSGLGERSSPIGSMEGFFLPDPTTGSFCTLLFFPGKEKTSSRDLVPKDKKKKAKKWGIYGDVFTFWTYQQATPNKNDEWIVSDMEGPGMLSTDRMGGKLSLGIYYSLSKNIELFGGLSAQLQQVHSAFRLRPLSAEEFEYSESDEAYLPSYNEEQFSLNQRLWSTGVRLGTRYYLPYGNRKFWFAPSVDYQRMISSRQSSASFVPKNQVYVNLDFGWTHKLSNSLYFNFSPALSYSLIQTTENANVVSMTPYSWGVSLGLSYRVK